MLRFDVFLVQHYLGTKSVGVYSVGVNVAEMVLLVSSTLNTIAFAKAATESSVAGGIARSAVFSLAASLAFWVFLACTGWFLIPFAFGSDFRDSYLPCLIVMAGVSAQCFAAPLMGYIHGVGGYPAKLMLISWIGFAVNLVANFALISPLGLTGAALATALAYAATALMVLVMFVKETGTGAGSWFGGVPGVLRAIGAKVL
jgi:O-antigen/teichoic acid export membrane protein